MTISVTNLDELTARVMEAHRSGVLPVILGPTASGKSRLSLLLAKRLSAARPCEIISADAFQVYRGMDVGTAKISKKAREEVPHHLIDILEPDEPFGAGEFVRRAELAIEEILSRGGLPMVAGGSMMYLWALVNGLNVSPPRDEAFRAENLSREELLAEISRLDPKSSVKFLEETRPRLIRAVEILRGTGMTYEEWSKQAATPPRYQYLQIRPDYDRSELYERINLRVDEMLAGGLIDEVKALRGRGISAAEQSQRGIGYREAHLYLDGEIDYAELVRLTKRNTRRFAKRQLTWIRKYFPDALVGGKF